MPSTIVAEPTAAEAGDTGASCRVLGIGARLTGPRLAAVLFLEAIAAVVVAIGVAQTGARASFAICGPPWFGSRPAWGGIRIGAHGVAWSMALCVVALLAVALVLAAAGATAYRPPLDPDNRRVALAASVIAGQPFVWVGAAITLVLALPALTGDATIGLATSSWRWFDQGLMLAALAAGAAVAWRACIAANSAPHRAQIIGGIFCLAALIFVALYVAGVTRVQGGGLAPALSPGTFLRHPPVMCHAPIPTQ